MSLRLLLIGLLVGFAGGLFGKGGSAVATPLLQLAGVPAFFAVASPLPATIPGTLVASLAYLKEGLYDRAGGVLERGPGVPGHHARGLEQRVRGGHRPAAPQQPRHRRPGPLLPRAPHHLAGPRRPSLPGTKRWLSAAVGIVVGFLAGLLANAGGFLLAPLYVRILRLPLKTAFACSLVASAVLAVPGTVVHVALGHVSWRIVLIFGLGSIPLSYLGARTAVRMNIKVLEPIFGGVLLVIGTLGAADSLGWRLHL